MQSFETRPIIYSQITTIRYLRLYHEKQLISVTQLSRGSYITTLIFKLFLEGTTELREYIMTFPFVEKYLHFKETSLKRSDIGKPFSTSLSKYLESPTSIFRMSVRLE